MLIFELNYSIPLRHFSLIVFFFSEISSLFTGKKGFLIIMYMLITRIVIKKEFLITTFNIALFRSYSVMNLNVLRLVGSPDQEGLEVQK